jgi:hypothetical protein
MMTTILASLCPWTPSFLPIEGVAIVADTRTTFIKDPRDRREWPPFDNTWKILELGKFGVGAYAGNQRRALGGLQALAGFLTRNPKPPVGPRTRERIRHLLSQRAAQTLAAMPKNRPKGSEEYQLLVAYVLGDDSYELLVFNEKGLTGVRWGDDRGPIAFGSGMNQPQSFGIELEEIVAKNQYQWSGHGGRLEQSAHMLAASFANAYLSTQTDSSTGGGVLPVILSASRGVEFLIYSEFHGDLSEEANPAEKWVYHTPELVIRSAITSSGQLSPGKLLRPGRILGLLVDQREQLSVVARAETTPVTVTARRWSPVAAESLPPHIDH